MLGSDYLGQPEEEGWNSLHQRHDPLKPVSRETAHPQTWSPQPFNLSFKDRGDAEEAGCNWPGTLILPQGGVEVLGRCGLCLRLSRTSP